MIKNTLRKTSAKALSPLTRVIETRLDIQESRIEDLKSIIERLLVAIEGVKNTDSILYVEKGLSIAKLKTGLKICIDPREVAIAPHMVLDGVWEEEMTRAWLRVCSPISVVFDVGANYGYYGLLSAKQSINHNRRVFLFEANPNLIPYIDRSLSINGLHQTVKVECLGVSDKEGSAELTVLEGFVGCSSLNTLDKLDSYLGGTMPVKKSESIKIKTTTIDQYCKLNKIKEVDVLKLDIEGYEDRAYAGMKNIVKASRNLVMFLEFTKKSYEKPKDFFSKLCKDFKYVYKINPAGDLIEVKSASYSECVEKVDSFVMLVFSKIPLPKHKRVGV